jgi:hypothetical protein
MPNSILNSASSRACAAAMYSTETMFPAEGAGDSKTEPLAMEAIWQELLLPPTSTYTGHSAIKWEA